MAVINRGLRAPPGALNAWSSAAHRCKIMLFFLQACAILCDSLKIKNTTWEKTYEKTIDGHRRNSLDGGRRICG
jgi:hypothetical protein